MGCGASSKSAKNEAPKRVEAPKTQEPPAPGKGKDGGTVPADEPAAANLAAAEKVAADKVAADEAVKAPAAKPDAVPVATATKGATEVRFADAPADSDEESEADEEAEAAFEAQVSLRTEKSGMVGRKSRMAVSSEVIYESEDFKAPVYPKTQEQEERLSKALSKSFMFAALSGDALPVVVKAFQEMKITTGSKVISQDEEVVAEKPALFVLETGQLSVYKNGQEVFQYNTPGQYFGELALLYNAPRAATVIADEDCTVWSIDRDTFNYLVKDAARIAVKNRIAFLEQVPILKGLEAEEKAKLSDVMNVKIVSKGEYVIKQGEVGTTFYIIESGKLEALKDGEKVLEYNAKDYFGELALLRHAPRAADVVASEMSKLLSLDAASFKRIVGSLEEMMKERAANYEGVEVTLPS